MKTKKLIALMMMLAMLTGLMPQVALAAEPVTIDLSTVSASGSGYTYAEELVNAKTEYVVTITDPRDYILTGTVSQESHPTRVKVTATTANITLSNASITIVNYAPLSISPGSTVNLTLAAGTVNTLSLGSGEVGFAGLYVPSGAAVIIDGAGTLNASGGGGGAGYGAGAGIGGMSYDGIANAGNITINSGVINATSRAGAAAIGGGYGGSGSSVDGSNKIIINGGTVTVDGSIGGGSVSTSSISTIRGGSVKSNELNYTNGTSDVHPTTVTVLDSGESALSDTDISCTLPSGVVFNAVTDSAGKLYLWLPAGNCTFTITSGVMNYRVISNIQTVTSSADPNTITTKPMTVTSVTVTPEAPEVEKGNTQAFGVSVLGTNYPFTEVTWSVTGGLADTSINSSGVLTVASNETASTLTVTATSTVDNTKSDSVTVTVTEAPTVAFTSIDSTGKVVTLTFSEAINAATAIAANFTGSAGTPSVGYTTGSTTLTLTYGTAISVGSGATIIVGSGVTDTTGNAAAVTTFTEGTTSGFTGVDTTAPTVAFTSIDSTGKIVTLTFNEAINVATAIAANFTGSAGTPTVGYTAGSTTLTLTYGTAISVGSGATIIVGTGVTDTAGNAVAETTFTEGTTSGFTGVDTTAPTVAFTSIDSTGKVVTLTFSEAIDAATAIAANFTGTAGTPTVGYTAGSTTLTLTYGTAISVGSGATIIVGTGVTDTAGNAVAVTTFTEGTTSGFTGVDTTAPTVAFTSIDSTGKVVTLTFSEAINAATAIAANFTGSAGTPTIGYSASSTTLTLTYGTAISAGSGATIIVGSGVTDTAGNPAAVTTFTEGTTSGFTGVDTTAPTVAFTSIDSTGKIVTLTFNEAINVATAIAANFTGSAGTPTVGYTAGSTTLTLTYGTAISVGSGATIIVGTGVTDTAGNAVAETTFTEGTTSGFTRVDTTAPTVAFTSIDSTGKVVTLTFSEAIDAATAIAANFTGTAGTPTVGYTAGSTTLTLTYGTAISVGSGATIIVGTGVTDTAGNAVAVTTFTEGTTSGFTGKSTSSSGDGASSGGSSTTKYSVSSATSTNGTVTLSATSVNQGGSVTLTITPDEGYRIADVLINGVSVGAVSSYTIKGVSKNTTIKVAFEKVEQENAEAWINPYSDVEESTWYYNSVSYVSRKGLMNGDGKQFSPHGDMTRAMVVTVLLRLSGDTGSFDNTFSDVDSGAWYEQAVAWASANGIASGVGGNSFAPEKALSREQLAVMLYSYAKYKGLDVTVTDSGVLDGYSDTGSVSVWAEDAMNWAVGMGIVSGDGANLYPHDTATRAQIAAMLQRFIENVIG